MLIELIFIIGPMLVALFVAFASASAAVWFAAACAFAGTLVFLRSPALRAWHIEPRASRSLLGPLGEPRFPALVGVVPCFSTAFGFMEIGVTAYATDKESAALAGILLGVVPAARLVHSPTAAAPGGRACSAGIALGRPFRSRCGACSGIAMAPALIIQSMLAASIARPEHATEAFTWTTSALLSGVGIGLAAGGVLLEVFPPTAALAACAALLGALLALTAL